MLLRGAVQTKASCLDLLVLGFHAVFGSSSVLCIAELLISVISYCSEGRTEILGSSQSIVAVSTPFEAIDGFKTLHTRTNMPANLPRDHCVLVQ